MVSGAGTVAGAIWSNGVIEAHHAPDTAATTYVASPPPPCPFPAQLTPPGPTAVAQQTSWPLLPPEPPSTCTSGEGTITSSWLETHKEGESIARPDGSRFEFISESGNRGINVTKPNTCVGYGANPQIVFYATRGDVTIAGSAEITIEGDILATGTTSKAVFNPEADSANSGFIEAQTVEINSGPATFVGEGPLPPSSQKATLVE